MADRPPWLRLPRTLGRWSACAVTRRAPYLQRMALTASAGQCRGAGAHHSGPPRTLSSRSVTSLWCWRATHALTRTPPVSHRLVRLTPYDFYIRQLRDWKASADIATMTEAAMRAHGEPCAWTLARAHARSGDRIAIAAYLGRSTVFDEVIREFAAAYADQHERDYRDLAVANKTGRVAAERDICGRIRSGGRSIASPAVIRQSRLRRSRSSHRAQAMRRQLSHRAAPRSEPCR